MSFAASGDEQSEDGELRQSPEPEPKPEVMDFSLSEEEEEEGEAADSLDIKPPQARSAQSGSSRTKRREITGKAHHKHSSERHRVDERTRPHREKHHRDKQMRSAKERESYHRDKERYYREQLAYKDSYTDVQYVNEKVYREHREETASRSGRHKREVRETKEQHEVREHREIHYAAGHRRHREEKWGEKLSGDRELQDLRERLLSKRSKGDEESTSYRGERGEGHRERARHRDESLDPVLQGEAGMYVKEIINISTGEDRKHKKQEKMREDDMLTEEERAEQDQRREKLLEAEREMARLKEQSRIERERRHLEKQAKRKLEDEDGTSNKRVNVGDGVIAVSDNSDNESETEKYQLQNYEEAKSDRSNNDSEIASRSPSIHGGRRTSDDEDRTDRSRSRSRSRHSSDSEGSRRSRSERSRSRSSSREEQLRSQSRSPKSNGNTVAADVAKAEEKKEEPKKIKELDESLPPYFPAISGCRSVEEFQCLNRIEEGTYGVVYRARDKRTEEIVALKRLKMEKEKEGFPITSLREINTLLKGQHPNMVTVREIVVGSNMDKIFIVMEYVEHDLKSLMETMRHKKQTFTTGEVKCLLKQLLCAVAHLHDNWILHRDLKTSNLLLSHKGILKVGDFGLAREYGSPLKAYTPIVVTLWYRAPELLLCTKEYSCPIDMWSVGCIFGELLLMNAVFPGKSEVDQLNRIFKDLGTPNEKIWPGYNKLPAVQKMKFAEHPNSNLRTRFHMLPETGLNMLQKLLTYDPSKRVTAEAALQHNYFTETPLPVDPSMFPTWPAKSELGHRRALAASPKPPSGGNEYKQLGDGDDDGIGFRISAGMMENRRMPMGGGFSLKF